MPAPDWFEDAEVPDVRLGRTAWVLRALARPHVDELLAQLEQVLAAAPLRRLQTPGGHTMSVALSNCGQVGWLSDRTGYRYAPLDPLTGRAWPAMPACVADLARHAAQRVGFDSFEPDACLVNEYVPGARMSLHQDRNERDFSAPIVSISLGMSATFLFGGNRRGDPVQRVTLRHGDVAVWGGEDRLRFHGVLALRGEAHPRLGARRWNLTVRRAR